VRKRVKPRALDIALRSGLSTSTVDRVINERGRVSTKAVRLVKDAQSELERQLSEPSSSTEAIEVILPENAGNSTRYLAAYLRLTGHQNSVAIELNWVNRMNPAALSAALLGALDRSPKGVIFQALDHPLVHEAANKLHSAGIRLTSIVSGMAGEAVGYVGMDNRAAGRTAALLMGNYCVGTGAVAVVWSGQLSRAHEERESGFRALMRAEFPDMPVRDINSGNDQPEENFRLVKGLLEQDSTISGIYCVGAGPSAIVDAVKAAGLINRIKIFAHNLTHVTRAHLLASEIDIVIHQNMHEIAERAVADILSLKPVKRYTAATHIVTRENALHQLDLNAINEWLDS